jgi:hypothetical protein
MDGYDHLSCALENFNKKKVMKIKGWEKISGYTYKGYTIVNPMHNAHETKYEATILNLNLPQKPKWELSVLTPQHKFIVGENTADGIFFISMWDDNKFSATRKMNKQTMKSISNFRQTFEEMVDEILGIQLTSAAVTASSHPFTINVNGNQRMRINSNGHAIVGNYSKSINPNLYGTALVTGTGGGIVNKVNNSGTISIYDSSTGISIDVLDTIKTLQKQIDELKLNTPSTPF